MYFNELRTISSFPSKLINKTSMAVVELKVGMHCDKCIKSIKRAIKKIEDIETYRLDTEVNKVTVTGNVTTEEVVKVLHKIGKTATSWSED
ncbi:copper transport protein CCH [Dioscorea cayenensis subsp. rotundata]|uniref:Copper transport protein CCH n=1 Tax=Dioscorea cayennensis subsp. rotundata TaxID=55577 RepID=A0AB40C0H2_DIOCR|nr:copper transport protein CCH [Dioscorea cayenensis subsp. rotundata]